MVCLCDEINGKLKSSEFLSKLANRGTADFDAIVDNWMYEISGALSTFIDIKAEIEKLEKLNNKVDHFPDLLLMAHYCHSNYQ